jgi:hypothetical protein
MDIYGEDYQRCQELSRQFEESETGQHYRRLFCLEEVEGVESRILESSYQRLQPHIVNTWEEVQSRVRKQLCVLPRGHRGPCRCFPRIFITGVELITKMNQKTKTAILNTPGADGRIFKNRCSRLFPIALTNEQELMLRQEHVPRLNCAIPLKEQTTPFMMASALIDRIIYNMNVNGMNEHIDQESPDFISYNEGGDKLNEHKIFLQKYFLSHNRRVFNDMGNTLCPVIHRTFEIENLVGLEHDMRLNPDRYDVQMGHISSRTNERYTIHGTNLVMMTRDGNRIIGEHSLIENDWIDSLRAVIAQFD